MTPATELQFQLKSKLNRINRNYASSVSVIEADRVLTEAYHTWHDKVSQHVEINDNVRRLLADFEVKFYTDETKFKNRHFHFNFPKDYHKSLRIQCLAYKEGCGERILDVWKAQSQKLNQLLRSPFWEPSFEYEETFADEYKEGLILYTKGFSIRECTIDYIKTPGVIRTPSLTVDKYYVDGRGNKVTENVNIPIDSISTVSKIVDIAALIVLRDKGDLQDFESQLNKINILESIS